MKQKVVIKLQMDCDKCTNKALKIAAQVPGVTAVSLEGNDKDRVVVTGDDMDTVCLANMLKKKFRCVTILSVEEVKKPVDNKDEEAKKQAAAKKKKEEEEKKKQEEEKKKLEELKRTLEIFGVIVCTNCDSSSCHGECDTCSKCKNKECDGKCVVICVKCKGKCGGSCHRCKKCESPKCGGECKRFCNNCNDSKCNGCKLPPPWCYAPYQPPACYPYPPCPVVYEPCSDPCSIM